MILRQKFFVSVPKIFVGESSIVALVWGTEKVWRREGRSIKIFRRKFFVSVPIKCHRGTL